jgi:hypothetical protein
VVQLISSGIYELTVEHVRTGCRNIKWHKLFYSDNRKGGSRWQTTTIYHF